MATSSPGAISRQPSRATASGGAWSGRTAAELFEKIQTTMPADRAGTLKPQQSADLVAYIFKFNDYPAGAADLASEMPALQQIKITSKK